MKQEIMITVAALAFAAPAAAQGVVMPQAVPPQAALEKQAVERARVAVESRITAGAPYSAEAVNESVQALADGNRIVRKTSTRIYRDSDGRTRREQLTSAGEVQSVSISDPVAGATFVLDPATKTAQRTGVIMTTTPSGFGTAAGGRGEFRAVRTPEGGVTVAVSEAELARRREVEAQAAASAGGGGTGSGSGRGRGAGSGGAAVAVVGDVHQGTVVYPAEGVAIARTAAPTGANVAREDLGTQVVEGVAATGTRTTTTIPAGSIGNEQPIVIVSEQWFSPELKVLVMTKHSDPRSGDTTYRLTNIAQSEPARSLFEVPPDYTLRESSIRRQSPMEQ